MPRTKKNPAIPPRNGPPAVTDVLTLAETAAYLRLASDDVLRLVREQALPGRQIGPDWRFLKSALQDWLKTGPAKKGLLELAGAIRDDPHAKELLEETYRRRGRPETEEA
jgi:excisionase family DNA binding protein